MKTSISSTRRPRSDGWLCSSIIVPDRRSAVADFTSHVVFYLRLLDVPLPSIYGPSADENPFAALT
jgi:hypothetical protein